MTQAKRYWAAVPKGIFESNLRIDGRKTYYNFHGEELCYTDNVGEIVRVVNEQGPPSTSPTWIIFKFVPVPSSMLGACWAGVMDDDPTMRVFEVRVHEKFEFPYVTRGSSMSQDPAEPETEEEADGREAAEFPDPGGLVQRYRSAWSFAYPFMESFYQTLNRMTYDPQLYDPQIPVETVRQLWNILSHLSLGNLDTAVDLMGKVPEDVWSHFSEEVQSGLRHLCNSTRCAARPEPDEPLRR